MSADQEIRQHACKMRNNLLVAATIVDNLLTRQGNILWLQNTVNNLGKKVGAFVKGYQYCHNNWLNKITNLAAKQGREKLHGAHHGPSIVITLEMSMSSSMGGSRSVGILARLGSVGMGILSGSTHKYPSQAFE